MAVIVAILALSINPRINEEQKYSTSVQDRHTVTFSSRVSWVNGF